MTELNGAAVAPQSITAEDLARIPPAPAGEESSGADAARAAAESGPGAGEESSSSSAPPPPSGAAALMFVDMVLALGVQVAAKRAGVKFRDVAALAKLSPDERELLEQFAPYAAPYLGAVGEASPIVGALAFAGITGLVLAGRFRDVRAIAPPRPSSTVSSAPPPSGARVVDVQHKQTWGKVADVVQPGAQVVDSGKFPDEKRAPA